MAVPAYKVWICVGELAYNEWICVVWLAYKVWICVVWLAYKVWICVGAGGLAYYINSSKGLAKYIDPLFNGEISKVHMDINIH